MSSELAVIGDLLVNRFIRVLIIGIILAPLALGAAVSIFNTQNNNGEYILLDANITISNTTKALYRITYNTTTGKLALKHIYDLNTTPLTIQLNNVDLTGNDVIAPHLYVFRMNDASIAFQGVTVKFNASWSFVAEWKLNSVKAVNPIAMASYRPVFLKQTDAGVLVAQFTTVETGTALSYSYDFGVTQSGTWYFGGSYYTAGGVLGVFNETSYYETTHTNTSQNHYGTIDIGYSGGWYLDGWIAYAIAWTQKLPVQDLQAIKESHIVPGNGIGFLADATFWNGTHFVDLAKGAYASQTNGVYRVPAEQTWLWLIKNAASDSLVHFKFFPVNTTVRLRDPVNGSILYEFNITGTPNQAGLVEDYIANVPAGNYTVEAVIEYEAGATIGGLPPYAIVKIDDGTVLKVPESGVITIPPGTHHIQVVAKKVTWENMDLPFTYDPATERLDINLGSAGAVWLYAVNSNSELTLWDTRTTSGIASFWGSGTVVYPVAIIYDWDGSARVIKNNYYIILPGTQFKLADYGTVITINTTLTAKQVKALTDELVIDNIRISNAEANVTILELLNNKIKLVADAPTGTVSYTIVRGVARPERVLIQHPDGSATEIKTFLTGDLNLLYLYNGEAAYYDPAQQLLVVKTIHHSPSTIVIEGETGVLMQTADAVATITHALLQVLKYAIPALALIVIVSQLFKAVKGGA